MEKRAIVVLCIILFLIPISVFGIFSAVKYGYALFMFDNADTYYKSKFDNPVINADYSGWEPYYFNDGRSMFFPDSWIISEDDGIYYITEENTLLGWGGYIGTDTAYSTKSELVQATLGYQTASSTCLHIRDNFAVYHAKYNGYEWLYLDLPVFFKGNIILSGALGRYDRLEGV